MTLLQAVSRVRAIIGDDPFWVDTEIKNWLNDGYLSFFSIRGIEELFYVSVTDQTRIPVPSDLFRIFDIYYLSSGATDKTLMDKDDYRIFDNYIEFSYSVTGTIYIEGERKPRILTDEESFELPDNLVIGIIHYAIATAYLKDEDEISAGSYMAQYLQKIREWENTPTLRRSKMYDRWYRGLS